MRCVRPAFLALMLAVAMLAKAPSPEAAPAGPLPDTSGILTSWRLEPSTPCVNDSIFMLVRGFVATPCEVFLGAEAVTPLFVRIRRQSFVDRMCLLPPTIFYEVPVALGRFPAGSHMGIVEVVTTEVRDGGATTQLAQQFRLDFAVAAECSIPPPPPPGPLPYVHTIGTEPPRPCAGAPTSLVLAGVFNDGCGQVIDAQVHDSHNVELTLKPYALRDTACTLALQPWRQDFDLGALASGPHRTNITLHVLVPDSTSPTPAFRRETYYGSHEFFVYGDCDSVPPPSQGLPYVDRIAVGRPEPCGQYAICPGESIQVQVSGRFPNNCFRFRRIVLIPSPATVFPPPPPTVRVIVDNGGCLGMPCATVEVPWSAGVMLPPMLPWGYDLNVELAEVICSDTYPPGELHRTSVPFAVADTCRPLGPCFTVDFAPGSSNACNAIIATGRPAELTFLVRPNVALAGLQGEFTLYPSLLRITRIEPIGPAEGMFIDWTATTEGARFVLFARSGAPIPAYPPVESGTSLGGGWPVLRVTVEHMNRGAPPPAQTVVVAQNLLGSDIRGEAVNLCPPPICADRDPRLAPPHAVICGELPCDFNADGLQDVRDLVLMVNCVNSELACPWDITRFDCNGDGAFGIADVLCCARHVLLQPPCPDCPPDTGQVRPEPDVGVSFGAPEETGGTVVLPVSFAGITRLGGALLTLEAPLDRYDVVGFDVSPPGDWLTLHEVRDGRIVLGLIDLHDPRRLDARVASTFALTLALRPGQPAGGQVTAVAGEFSGPDGVTLGVELGRPSQRLPGGTQVMLGANQPNPFSTETEFTLQLEEAADVDVSIYDLRGRAVATLHRAPLTPGPHVFKWDGRGSDGRSAPNGIYFYKVDAGGKSVARKLILMRGN